MNPEVWDRIEATLDRTTALAEKNEKKLDRLEDGLDKLEKTTAERTTAIFNTLDRMAKEREIAAREREIAQKKRDESLAKLEKTVEQTTKAVERMSKAVEKTDNAVSGVKEELVGISRSNGMMSEDYFFASLFASKMLGGVHFDDVQDNVGGMVKLSDGTKIKGQYDIVMYNDTAVCIVEVKYRLRKEDVLDVANRYADNFRKLFPAYADYKIYLAVGGMVIEKDAMETAKQYGMGILKQNGNAIVVYDENLKVY